MIRPVVNTRHTIPARRGGRPLLRYLTFDLVVLMVTTYKLEDTDPHLTMLLFAVIDCCVHMFYPPISTIHFPVYILTPSLTRCLMVQSWWTIKRSQPLKLIEYYWWIIIINCSKLTSSENYGTNNMRSMFVIRRISFVKLCTYPVIQLSSCAALAQWNIGDQIRRISVLFGIRPLVYLFGSILATTSPWIRSSVL